MGPASGAQQAPKASSPPSMPTAADWDWVLDTKPSATLATPAQKSNDSIDGGKNKNDKDARNGTSLNGQDQVQPRRSSLLSLPPPHISIPVGDEELDLQHRYFPHMSDIRDMCILCLQHGHKALSCPSNACKYCGVEYKHSSYACPSKRRCAQCKGLGHTAEACTEDHNWDTDLPCAHCGENHLERDCDVLWRTYRQVDPVKQAHSISAFCATCGEEGHYYSDCALATDETPKSRTWSQANLARCLDKASKRAPISDFKPPKPSSQLRRPELVGRPSENIYFESDDSDADTPFIGNRVQPKQPVGRISVSSNIHFGGQTNRPYGQPSTALPPRPQSYANTIPGENRQQDGTRRPHQLPPRPPAARRGGGGASGGNYQAVPPPPALQWNPSQGNASRDNGNGNSGGGGRGKNPSRGGRGGGRGNGRGGGGNSRSSRVGKW
ncbi:uncharacterized protein DNG_00817 [Cephalotrichum gorgonifer]|uniref:CCHC-type domain-containing protein n=1 Tax=Cephalotrichum gorgonifer TaxID=2041049 RepID=A0AAE8SRM0_9PEZI|nr:uncharacterized protein DNG_00817 [Cephalotrichum gorgonifer]